MSDLAIETPRTLDVSAAALEALADEQQLTDRAEQALAARLQALLLESAASPAPTTAALLPRDVAVSPAALRSIIEPLVVPMLLAVGVILMRRSKRRGDSSSWHAVIDKVVSRAVESVADTVRREESKRGTDDIYDDSAIAPAHRARMIANTLVTAIVEDFKHRLANRMGFEYKQWQSRDDARVRPTHVSLNGQTVHRTDKFVSQSGARLDGPGDQSAPVSEWINCRCRTLWLTAREAR